MQNITQIIQKCLPGLAIKNILLVLSLSIFMQNALAQPPEKGYFGIGIGSLSDNDFGAATIRILSGYDLNQHFALEGHFGSSDSDTNEVGGLTIKSKFDYFSSIRLRANYRRTNLRAYFFLGATGARVSVGNETDSHAGLSYGIGVDLFGSRETALFFSWGRLLEKDDDDVNFETNALTIGFRHFLYPQRSTHRIPTRI